MIFLFALGSLVDVNTNYLGGERGIVVTELFTLLLWSVVVLDGGNVWRHHGAE